MTKRLQRLFDRYNRLYWQGKMPVYGVIPATLEENTCGRCDYVKRLIQIDPVKHKHAAQLRGTMLHEMAHASAAQRGSRGHDVKVIECSSVG
jgi:hypothetical protein